MLRRHVSSGLALPEPGTPKVAITHQGSGQRFALEASFDATGVATSQWQIPKEAKLGNYLVTIDDEPSASFRVEEFRLPSMKASVTGPAHPQVAARSVDLDLHVAYLAGGGASGLPVKVRTFVEPRPLHLPDYPDYPDYQFGGDPVTPGVTTGEGGVADYDFEAQSERETTRTRTTPLALDGAGAARVTIGELPALGGPSRLVAELEYADANGEVLTTTGYVALRPAALSVGIRREGWVGTASRLRFRVLVLDLDGKPAAGRPVSAALYQSSEYSYRRRLVGGFYSYETTRETRRLDPACNGTSDAQGLVLCDVAPGVSGQIIVRAETQDGQGRTAGATTSMWVYDQDEWWFGGTAGDRMDLLPEKKEYDTGDTARLQVRMPFRAATALVTVEREGVLESFVTRLSGRAPIVEVPLRASFSPNVYVSVLAVRGRVASVSERGEAVPRERAVTALVDLTKPAYRLGVAQLRVGWKPHRLDVRVEPAGSTFRVRERVAVKVHVSAADGSALAPGSEVAVAAVDEALLELAPNPSWDLLEAMMGQRGLEVWTSTAQTQVVGKRHYGRKAIPHGGGGGRELDRARELFDSLLFWQPHVRLDARGDASVLIALNDSLSAFRIVAVGRSGIERFGTGEASINTTQDLVLVSGLPPLVREGDDYLATVTVRNTTRQAFTAQVLARVEGLAAALPAQQAAVPAGEARDLAWRVTVPFGLSALRWDVTATAGAARDHLKLTQSVIPAVPVRTYQATIAQLSRPLTYEAQLPQGAIPGRGALEVALQGRLADNLEGVTEYMSFYPYSCLEQRISRAVALHDRQAWDTIMRGLPAYMDADGLLKYFPSEWIPGDDSLTAYVLEISAESGWPIEDQDRSRLLDALARFVAGKIRRDSALPTADLAVRKLQAL
ncbi:MAG TPA: alpha-2-macroglobulin family protein, partial [Steroidobacteraceae bacterium]|nr:alpha-2-macroglobulin family protein [Steroidobacteraceae bacterium]